MVGDERELGDILSVHVPRAHSFKFPEGLLYVSGAFVRESKPNQDLFGYLFRHRA